MKLLRLLFAALLMLPGSVFAQALGGAGPVKPERPGSLDPTKPDTAFTAVIANDYVSRGVTQTGGLPELSVGLEGGLLGIYAGVTGFNVNFRHEGNRQSKAEVDLYGGYTFKAEGQAFDLGIIRYSYVSGPRGQSSLNNTEIYIKSGRLFGPVTVGAAYYYSPHGPSASGVNSYVVGSTSVTLSKRWMVSGLFGRQHIQAGGSYSNFNAGITYALTKSLNLDLRYFRTNRSSLGPDYRPRKVISLQLAL